MKYMIIPLFLGYMNFTSVENSGSYDGNTDFVAGVMAVLLSCIVALLFLCLWKMDSWRKKRELSSQSTYHMLPETTPLKQFVERDVV